MQAQAGSKAQKGSDTSNPRTGKPTVASRTTPKDLPYVEKTSRPLNIVFVSAEVAPWSKTGGLGDVVGALPCELARRGHKVMTVAPRYDQYYDAWDTSVSSTIMGEKVNYFHTVDQGVDRVWVDNPLFLAKVWGKTGSKLYGQKAGTDFEDNQRRFRIFCEAAIEAARVLPFSPGEDVVFVANDWHSAMIPILLKTVYQVRPRQCAHPAPLGQALGLDKYQPLHMSHQHPDPRSSAVLPHALLSLAVRRRVSPHRPPRIASPPTAPRRTLTPPLSLPAAPRPVPGCQDGFLHPQHRLPGALPRGQLRSARAPPLGEGVLRL